MDIVVKRQEEANKLLADAAAARQEAADARADADKARTKIAAERERLIAEARDAAQVEKQNLLAHSSEEIAKRRGEAEAAIARDRAAAEEAIIDRASDLSVDIAQRLLARSRIRISSTHSSMRFAARCAHCQPRREQASHPPPRRVTQSKSSRLHRFPARRRSMFASALKDGFRSSIAIRVSQRSGNHRWHRTQGPNAIIRNSWRADLDRIRQELSRDKHSRHLDAWLSDARKRVKATPLAPTAEQVGRVETVADGIALVSGLPGVRLDELVRFQRGQVGFAATLDRDTFGCVLLDDPEAIEAGDLVYGTGQVVRVPVGPGLLGRTRRSAWPSARRWRR